MIGWIVEELAQTGGAISSLLRVFMEAFGFRRILVDAGGTADEAIGARPASTEKTGSRSPVSGHYAISPIETQSAGRQSIYVWGNDMGLPVAAEFRPQIIDGDHENIRTVFLRHEC